jgi:thioesterase domain-containing protein/acyl carrier protein
VPDTNTASKIELLTQLWCRVLQLSTVGPEDNFFDLGGDSALAVQLFSEIAGTFGQQLPPVMIYHVPTIVSQAALLERPANPELSPLVQLKAGGPQGTLYIAPGLGGGPAEFLELAKFMHTSHSIYGLQPKGIEGFDDPSARIEDMAEFYTQAIVRFQPKGPYILGGYSLGGLVALEMARRILARGDKISLLVLLDSYPHMKFLTTGQRLQLLVQRARFRVSNFRRPPRKDQRLGGLASADEISSFAPAFGRVRESAYLALRRYRPTFYPGTVKFIRAAEISDFPEDPIPVWSSLVEKIEVETVPGDHLGMLTTHPNVVASVLSRYLEETLVAPDGRAPADARTSA